MHIVVRVRGYTQTKIMNLPFIGLRKRQIWDYLPRKEYWDYATIMEMVSKRISQKPCIGIRKQRKQGTLVLKIIWHFAIRMVRA